MKLESSILKSFFSKITKRVAITGSLFLMLLFSGVLISSLFISSHTLDELAQSQYFQSKVIQALEKNDIDPRGPLSIKFNNLNKTKISIEKANLALKNNDFLASNILLEVDLIKYFFDLSFINKVSIGEIKFGSLKDSNIQFVDTINPISRIFPHYIKELLENINSKSIYVSKISFKIAGSVLAFNDLEVNHSKSSIIGKSKVLFETLEGTSFFSASIKLILKDSNTVDFEIFPNNILFGENSNIRRAIKIINQVSASFMRYPVYQEKKAHEVNFKGSYDLNSDILALRLLDKTEKITFRTSIKILTSLENKKLMFRETELLFGETVFIASYLNYNFHSRAFETNVSRVVVPEPYGNDIFGGIKINGIFPVSEDVLFELNVIEDKNLNLNARIELAEVVGKLDNRKSSFQLNINLVSINKLILDNIEFLNDFLSLTKNKTLSLSDANLKIGFDFENNNFRIKALNGSANELIYFENDIRIVALKNLEMVKNLSQGFISIELAKKIQPATTVYRNVKLEFSELANTEKEGEVTLSFVSKIESIISLATGSNKGLNWVSSLLAAHSKNDVFINYTKNISLEKIGDFFDVEGSMFEVTTKDFSLNTNSKDKISLNTLNLRGVGETILFEGVINDENYKISGSIINALPVILGDSNAKNLIIFVDNFNSKNFFPDLSAFIAQGPLKIDLEALGMENGTDIKGSIDFTNAKLTIPSLALKKSKDRFSQLKFEYIGKKTTSFMYQQKSVLVSGTSFHKSLFEIDKISYSRIKTPDIQIEGATFQKLSGYNQFKANGGVVDLDFLMRLKFKKKKIPLDFIFNDLILQFKERVFLNSAKGEIRAFEGLRGYVKAKLSSKSNLEVTISPNTTDSINLVFSGNDAGELLRRGNYYKNGYGGKFEASIIYRDKTKISGNLEIENFRIKRAPVLAQIISSASIIGLLDNLNGNGLLFTKIEGSFDFKDNILVLNDGVAVGPSLGLTMSGYESYNGKRNMVNVNGLVSPVYIINGVVKAIPLIGKVLGGERGEGVFGVYYKVKGESSDPNVLVNPLSILTPGVFRKIFNIQNDGR